eukprot:CAMPEP_0183515802 /NCGR_PEP_ID=MMETSP0371-20130417/13760_1 /TAXON_ID=268820 /ORGANISM="Peridinium aciculiferum, Strain PAER-2" /LENGTH=127 /DNA_ID=CAMNT_0025713421 /DNA_START=55 /DNA_END=438 /DNA_ORIENTATION=-
MTSMFRAPRAQDLVTDEDVKTWVLAAMDATMPALLKECREVLLFAMQEHKKVLAEQTVIMRRTLEEQSAQMIRTLEVQGRTVSRLIAFGGLSGICSALWKDLEGDRKAQYSLAVGYGLGVFVIILWV